MTSGEYHASLVSHVSASDWRTKLRSSILHPRPGAVQPALDSTCSPPPPTGADSFHCIGIRRATACRFPRRTSDGAVGGRRPPFESTIVCQTRPQPQLRRSVLRIARFKRSTAVEIRPPINGHRARLGRRPIARGRSRWRRSSGRFLTGGHCAALIAQTTTTTMTTSSRQRPRRWTDHSLRRSPLKGLHRPSLLSAGAGCCCSCCCCRCCAFGPVRARRDSTRSAVRQSICHESVCNCHCRRHCALFIVFVILLS